MPDWLTDVQGWPSKIGRNIIRRPHFTYWIDRIYLREGRFYVGFPWPNSHMNR